MKMILKVTITLALVSLATGCAGGTPVPKATDSGLNLKGKTIYIQSDKATYSVNSHIAQNIKDECSLDSKLITFIKNAANKQGFTVQTSSNIPSNAIELKVEITDSISRGNAFIGHRKFTSIAGNLTQAGVTIGTFEAARRSGGGAFGGFKGSCAVLGRTVETLGSDVSKWIVKPSTGAELGDTNLIPRR